MTPDLISESWTLPFLQCKLLQIAMLECLDGLMRTTKNESRRFQEVKERVLTSGWLVTHCLLQFGAFLAIPNPLGGQLVP